VRTDFLTNVETAFLKTFTANSILNAYNWQRWDSDEIVELPRAVLGLRAMRDPDDTPYHKLYVVIRLEGRPKQHKLTVIVNELKDVLETTTETDLYTASGNTVNFIGRALSIGEDRQIAEGLRVWLFSFVIYALPMV